jgi:hypothetical protein
VCRIKKVRRLDESAKESTKYTAHVAAHRTRNIPHHSDGDEEVGPKLVVGPLGAAAEDVLIDAATVHDGPVHHVARIAFQRHVEVLLETLPQAILPFLEM